MRVMITGASGLLGSTAYSYYKHSCDVFVFAKKDLSDQERIRESVCNFRPDVFIHCAAITDLEYCEVNVADSFIVNTLLPIEISNICRELGVKFVFISSTGVYGGSETYPHCDDDHVNPPTVHHLNKYQSELGVFKSNPHALILRTGWLFGGEKLMKKNFVHNRMVEAKNNSVIYSNNEQYGSPTYCNDVIETVSFLTTKNVSGTINCVNTGCVSRYEYVKKIIELAGIDCDVKPVPASSFNRLSKVSNNECAINSRLNDIVDSPMPDWDDSLARYIELIES